MTYDINKSPYVCVRSKSAGVFTGNLYSENGNTVEMKNARRIWYWAGAASLSQLAKEGVKNPEECKFPCELDHIKVFDIIEIIPMPKEAEKNIKNVPVWEIKE